MQITPIKRYAVLILGAAILSFGLKNVHAQSLITEGGVLGATLLVRHWTGISPAITETVLDALCYLLGLKLLGKGFFKNAIIATAAFACFYTLWEKVGCLLPNFQARPLVAALLGAAFVGLGAGLVVRAGGASGGDDALALVLSNMLHCNIAWAYFGTDATVLLLSLSYIPLSSILFSLLSVMLSSALIGGIQKIGTKRQSS